MSAKSSDRERSATLGKKVKQPSVSPHRINNFVCESSPNRLILDFGNADNCVKNGSENGSDLSGTSTGHNSSTECSSRSSVGLLEKMKQKTKTSIKRSISSVSNKSRNKRENSSKNNSKSEISNCDPQSKDFINYKYSPTNSSLTLSTISTTHNSMTSLQSTQTLTSSAHHYNGKINETKLSRQSSRQSSVASFDKADASSNNSKNEPIYGTTRRNITKPSHAPPPPPVKTVKPNLPSQNPPISKGIFRAENVPFITPVLDKEELHASNNLDELSATSPKKISIFKEDPDKEPESIPAENVPFITPVLEERDFATIDNHKESCKVSLTNTIFTKTSPNLKSNSLSPSPVISETKLTSVKTDIDAQDTLHQNTKVEIEKSKTYTEPVKPLEDFKIDLQVDVVSRVLYLAPPSHGLR